MRRTNANLSVLTAGQLAGTDSVVRGSGCLTWHSTYETTGSASASYALYDGPARSDTFLMYVTLSAGQSTRDYIGFHCLPFVQALHIVVESGTIGGNLVAWVDHVCEDVLNWRHAVEQAEGLAAFAALGIK